MNVEPASIVQIQRALDGQMVVIDADVGSVAADIQQLDPCLRLRYSEAAEVWIVYRVHRDGQPCRLDDPERTEELVLTARACDQRIVKRLEEIDPHGRGGYDYARALEQANLDREQKLRDEFRKRVEPTAEQAAYAIRKDLGSKSRVVVPRDLPPAA